MLNQKLPYFNKFCSHATLGKNAIGNYVSDTDFIFQAEARQKIAISRLLVCYADTYPFAANKYAKNITLTNGIKLYKTQIKDGQTEEIDLLDGETIKTNTDWNKFSCSATPLDYGLGVETMVVKWGFCECGTILILNEQEKFIVRLKDDFTDLTKHTFCLQGWVEADLNMKRGRIGYTTILINFF
jgi:hypothetical protein